MVSKMQDKCPNCGETVITRTIKKQLGLGSIDYPVAKVCPKCNWSKDLTGAGDIVSKPVMATGEIKKEQVKPPVVKSVPPKIQPSADINRYITIALAIIVLVALAWAFYPTAQPQQVDNTPKSTATPVTTQTPIATPTPTSTIVPEVTATGNKTLIKLDSRRGFLPDTKTIKPGDEVIWENSEVETVTLISSDGLLISDNGLSDNQIIPYGQRTNYIFKKQGTYNFIMKNPTNTNFTGTIIVGT